MAESTITQVFGAGATQTDTTLTISKADLAAVGLTATATNTAESLFVALLLLAKQQLTTTNQEANPEQSITIDDAFGGDTLVTRNNQTYRQKSYTANLQKLDTQSGINPNDY